MLDLSKYETKGESSLYKGIPIVYRYDPLVRELMKTRLFSVKYRGCSKKGYRAQMVVIKSMQILSQSIPIQTILNTKRLEKSMRP